MFKLSDKVEFMGAKGTIISVDEVKGVLVSFPKGFKMWFTSEGYFNSKFKKKKLKHSESKDYSDYVSYDNKDSRPGLAEIPVQMPRITINPNLRAQRISPETIQEENRATQPTQTMQDEISRMSQEAVANLRRQLRLPNE